MLSGVYADLEAANEVSGLSIWLQACIPALPGALRGLLAAGCSVAETYVDGPAYANEEGYRSGWSCLFFVVLHASRPESSAESESLRTLLSAGADPFSCGMQKDTRFLTTSTAMPTFIKIPMMSISTTGESYDIMPLRGLTSASTTL
jgi:hypothetical protein